ncbi:unnamed protein product [Mytilus coruscus]|uniref:Uncharacterized protein n=1 Tax=Mytilus coruscus TaxID=42192 RepID=A0A6J8A108_MYTCO|nr:unnamed protein product [Mytilus coruscus]
MVEDNRIIVYLTNISSRSCISPDIAASIQECLTVTLQAILKFYLFSIGKNDQQVNVSNLFHIEVGGVCGRSPCVVSISKAKQSPDWMCVSGNRHFSRIPLLWVFNKTQQECPPNCPGLDESILTMSPSEQHLSRLAYQLNIQSCRELISNLGIQLTDWEDIEYSYIRMPLIIKIMALNFWKTKNIVGRPNKSFNNLLDALKAVGDKRHLLCKVFREDTHLIEDFIVVGLHDFSAAANEFSKSLPSTTQKEEFVAFLKQKSYSQTQGYSINQIDQEDRSPFKADQMVEISEAGNDTKHVQGKKGVNDQEKNSFIEVANTKVIGTFKNADRATRFFVR